MNFCRTLGGKILIFALCLIFAVTALASGVAAILMVDYNFYTEGINDVYADMIHGKLVDDGYIAIWDYYEQDDPMKIGNLSYLIMAEGGEILAISNKAKSDVQFPDYWYHETYWADLTNDGQLISVDLGEFDPCPIGGRFKKLTVYFSLDPKLPERDAYSLLWRVTRLGWQLRYAVYPIGFVSLMLAAALFVVLMCVSARRPNTEELYPGVLHRVPFDLLAAVCFVGCACAAAALGYVEPDWLMFIIAIPLCLVIGSIALGLCMSFAARVKTKTLLKNTVIYRVVRLVCRFFRWVWQLISRIPLVWRTALIVFGISLIEFLVIVVAGYVENIIIFWFLEKLLLVPAVIYLALCLRKLQKGGEALAAGDLGYRTDTKGLFWDFERHGDNLNGIARGMNAAVEERLRSERMKTELITNVSHDLKTPLTSVINYADLIAREPCENEKITEYAGVLNRQSERLRRLIDDLVEASKASTGNLEVNLAPCDAAVFLTQAAGEYAEKLERAGLSLITRCPEDEVLIQADGRRMWRIFDNLMNNICKYAQSGTRVYLTLEGIGDNAVITFKNTSAQMLDVSEEELMERFVRGDSARSTEGNGLGLSIAKSLAELQGGRLRIAIDGDLFKAIATFPRIK